MQNDVGDLVVKTVLASDEIDCVARYLSRGRRLRSLDEATLKQLGVDETRRRLCERVDNELWHDACGELSLRGINLELPPELQAAVIQELLKPEVFKFLAGVLISAFNRVRAEPKN